MSWTDLGIAAGKWALVSSTGAAVLTILILAVQWVLDDRISPRWRHNLLLLVVARLMLPTIPGFRVPMPYFPKQHAEAKAVVPLTSLHPSPAVTIQQPLKLTDNAPNPVTVAEPFHWLQVDRTEASPSAEIEHPAVVSHTAPPAHLEAAAFHGPSVVLSSPPQQIVAKHERIISAFPWRWVALLTWISGVVVVAAWFGFTTLRLWFVTRKFQRVDDEELLRLLNLCARNVGLRRCPLLFAAPNDFGPALVGLFRPRLIVPQFVLDGFNHHELRSILLHELVHCRRHDVAVNYLLAALSSIHWFNPFVWFAFARLRAERELACDQAVMKLSPPRERLSYGCTILKLLELAGRGALVPTAAVGVIGNKGLMQRRIAMIARFDRRQTRRSVAAITLSSLIAGATIAAPSLAQDKPASTPPTPEAAVNQARHAIDVLAAKPEAPVAPPSPDPLAPVPAPALPLAVPATPPAAPAPRGVALRPGAVAVEGPLPVADPPAPRLRGDRSANGFENSPRSVEDTSATDANAKTMERLKQSRPLESHEAPLRDVLRQIADFGKLDIVTDDKALEDAGVDLDTRINLRVHEPRPLEQLLEMSLRLAGSQIDYTVLNGVIFVSSRPQLSSRIVTRVYDIGNADQNGLTELLITGTGLVPHVSYVGNKLVVTASELTQRHVAKLLSAVSDQMSQHHSGQANRNSRETAVRPLQFAEAQDIKKVISTVCSPDMIINIDPRTNSLIMTAAPEDIQAVSGLIEKLDIPGRQGGGENAGGPQKAEDTVAKLRVLAETAIKYSKIYGAHSKQLDDVARQVDSAGTEVSKWIDTLAKDGNVPAADKLKSEFDQIKALLAPLAKDFQGNHPPEGAQ